MSRSLVCRLLVTFAVCGCGCVSRSTDDLLSKAEDAATCDSRGIDGSGCHGCADGERTDSDGDGVCDRPDRCPGASDSLDSDSDGVPDACDPCPLDPNDDSDDDGVCDSSDACPGHDDRLDSDADGIPNDCDSDSDNIADGCALAADRDGDGLCGQRDPCPDDPLNDEDHDGLCAPLDPCPRDPSGADDDDGDGVCNTDDVCPAFDDLADRDGDAIPDGCDTCPAGDNQQDGDQDGVPDGCDVCPWGDDGSDSDINGVPDACDTGLPGSTWNNEIWLRNSNLRNANYPLFMNEEVILTPNEPARSAAVFSATPRTPPFSVQFDYAIGDNDGCNACVWSTGDGFAFLFNKDPQAYGHQEPPSGSALGFLPDGSGYGIFFLLYGSRRIELRDGSGAQISDPAPTDLYQGGAWTHVRIDISDSTLSVWVGGRLAFTFASTAPWDKVNKFAGFTAATGIAAGEHRIRNVRWGLPAPH